MPAAADNFGMHCDRIRRSKFSSQAPKLMILQWHMANPIPRRSFVNLCLRAGVASAALVKLDQRPTVAVEPIKRPGSPRLLLSLAAYSFRDYFVSTSHKRDKETDTAKRIDMFQFVDYCADHGCQGAEVTSYYFPSDVDHAYLTKLKRHAFLRGVALSGTAVGNTFTHSAGEKRNNEIASVKKWIDRAQTMGAPHVRVFAGGTERNSKADAKKLCIEALEECCAYAGTKGIVLGLENHGGIVPEADDTVDIVRAVQSPWIGINLDTGNFNTADPYADIAKCAPYAVNVQFKSEIHRRGQKKEATDFDRVMKILHEANYQGYVALEYEAAEDPWQAVPGLLKRMKESF